MIRQESIYKTIELSEGTKKAKNNYLEEIRPAMMETLQRFGFYLLYSGTGSIYGYIDDWAINIDFGKLIIIMVTEKYQIVQKFYFLYDEYINLAEIISTYTPQKESTPEYRLSTIMKSFISLGIDARQNKDRILAFDKNLVYISTIALHYPYGQIRAYVGQTYLGTYEYLGQDTLAEIIQRNKSLYS